MVQQGGERWPLGAAGRAAAVAAAAAELPALPGKSAGSLPPKALDIELLRAAGVCELGSRLALAGKRTGGG